VLIVLVQDVLWGCCDTWFDIYVFDLRNVPVEVNKVSFMVDCPHGDFSRLHQVPMCLTYVVKGEKLEAAAWGVKSILPSNRRRSIHV